MGSQMKGSCNGEGKGNGGDGGKERRRPWRMMVRVKSQILPTQNTLMNDQEAKIEKGIEDEAAPEHHHRQQQQSPMAASAMDGVAAAALRLVLHRVQQAAVRSGRSSDRIRVVAVSKTKSVSLIREVYDSGHRCFGENYVQEIIEKAPQLPDDIEWHFIGNLQSNKVKPLLAGVPNLAVVETVDDEKIANQLNRVVANIGRNPLKVFVQVNTSGEESKSGVDPSGCMELVKHTLENCRSEVCKALGIAEEQCELSMGMSGDFQLAVEMGSTNVRIGSTIFGAREYPKKQSN
ncbi:hypothetical protein HYC85_017718 [Camellia sinensis]|uniref:Pyridoxal phosphate homeostasis protein n=1 Tax=Camellia sinensis TaxID=4442 RepID=A0A7J7GUM0_CAMSI|nr:hypothetical protein HYC85_017718 [Camellia sinensis]